MIEREDNKNKRKGWIASAVFHGVLLLAFLFGLAWQAPNPPEEEYGIELNFGTDPAGEGDVQPLTPAAVTETVEDPAPEAPAEAEEIEESEPVVETTESVETVPEEAVTEDKPVEKTQITQPQPSPTKVEEKPKVVEKKPMVKKPEPKVDPRSTYPGKSTTDGSGGKTGASKNPATANQGDTKGTVGDQGDPEGDLDSRALYGKAGGGGGGPKLEIAGWNWDRTPNQKDTSNDNGFVIFEFKIDDEGYVTTIRTLKSTVSPQVTNFYKEQLRKTTFSTTSDNARPAASTTGKVTFVIRSS